MMIILLFSRNRSVSFEQPEYQLISGLVCLTSIWAKQVRLTHQQSWPVKKSVFLEKAGFFVAAVDAAED